MKKFTMLLALVLLAVMAPLAQATMTITYQVDALAPVTCTGTATSVFCAPAVVGGVTLGFLTGASNSTGSAGQSFASSAQVQLQNTTAVNHTVQINIYADGFLVPTTPPALTFNSNVSTNTTLGKAGSTFAYTSCISPTGSGCAGALFTSATLNPTITVTNQTSSLSTTSTISPLAAPYTIAEYLNVVLAPGENLGSSAGTSLTSVPEPMSIALLGGTILLLSGRLLRRRRT